MIDQPLINKLSDKPRKITILGSTGSIGMQTLEVIDSLNGLFEIEYLTINTRYDLLSPQVEKFNPRGVAIKEKWAYDKFLSETNFKGEILLGDEGINQAAAWEDNDLVVSALVGFSGVIPTLAAISAGTNVALANKETLVSAGQVIKTAAKKNNVSIIAIDSEHSAILQCLIGEQNDEVEKLILTASGGPFLNTPMEEFKSLTVSQALNHPNWSMGNKISIDSATMMNKGFEVIEAFWLFEVESKNIEVIIHPQSIIHSMVQFVDGSVKAQLGLPDMRIPISYALTYPRRMGYDFPRMNLSKIGNLTFLKPDYERFACLELAFDSISMGGTAPTVLNAANEIAVENFLKEKIAFTDIASLIEDTLSGINIIQNPTFEEIQYADLISREYCKKLILNKYITKK